MNEIGEARAKARDDLDEVDKKVLKVLASDGLYLKAEIAKISGLTRM